MLLAASQLRDGSLTVGDFVLFVSYLGFITDFTAELGRYLAQFRQTTVAFERMQTLLGEAPATALAASSTAASAWPAAGESRRLRSGGLEPLRLVAATGLTYRHPETGQGIVDVDLCLPRGTLTVVTGRVGAGKTTLLRTFLGLLPPEAGEIRWNGALVEDPAAFFTPPRAAYTAQMPRLFSETLRRNILLGLPDDPALLSARGSRRGARARYRRLPARAGDAGRHARRRALRRSGAAHRASPACWCARPTCW